jgi:hypothetical protein
MSLKQRLNAFFNEILKEAETNSDFNARLEAALGGFNNREKKPKGRANRRSPAVIDPFAELERGESHLRQRLSELSLEQLRDVLAQYGMDRSKLAMKWKENDRIADLIVKSVITRATKGDVFRGENHNAPPVGSPLAQEHRPALKSNRDSVGTEH